MSNKIQKYDESQSVELVNKCNALAIKNEAGYKDACAIFRAIPEMKKPIDEVLGANKDIAFQAYKSASELYKKAVGALEQAEEILKGKLKEYVDSRKTDPTADGISLRDDWKAEVMDKALVGRQVS